MVSLKLELLLCEKVGKDKLQISRRYLQATYLTNDLYPEYIKNFQHSGVKKPTKKPQTQLENG